MNRTGFRQTIDALIRDTGESGPFPLEPCLRGLSRGYKAAVTLKNRLYGKGLIEALRLSCPVISIGNITVGGTGKTPMTVFVARHLAERRFSPLILSRGYGGSASEKGGMVSDGQRLIMDASEAGDEPYMMAAALKGVPVFVGKNRRETGIKALAQCSPDLILLDDGFQHRKLNRDLDILLLDGAHPLGNGFLLPRGPLREPPAALERAHVFVLTRSNRVADPIKTFRSRLAALGLPGFVLDTPVFACVHRPVLRGLKKAGAAAQMVPEAEVPSHRVFGFSGIADNSDVQRSLADLGFSVAGFMGFPDHHPYRPEDLAAISEGARACGAVSLVTTEKDAARLGKTLTFSRDLRVVGIDIDFTGDDDCLIDLIVSRAGLVGR